MKTFYWHDYETFGADPLRTRPAQFAGLRTDESLAPVGDPLVLYCRPANDYLPSPEACLITGITPQQADREGVSEHEFAARIHAQLEQPGTCSVGYNSLRFDDQVTRALLYRNFFEPYAREWQNGNSRWDLINVARLCYALRPDGIEWPLRDDGAPSFRLEDLARANRISQSRAHDALADVEATLGLARLLRDRQPRLFDWCLTLRQTEVAARLLDTGCAEPVVHASGRIAGARGGVALITPLARHPGRRHGVICFDLDADPEPLLILSSDDIADRVFTRTADLPDDVARLPLKVIHANRAPVLAPLATLRGVDTERIGMDVELARRRHDALREGAELAAKLREVFDVARPDGTDDADYALYSGGFIERTHSSRFEALRAADPAELAQFQFGDERLDELLFRYRARNYAQSLSAAERERWRKHRRARLLDGAVDGARSLAQFSAALDDARRTHEPTALPILDQLEAWAENICSDLDDEINPVR